MCLLIKACLLFDKVLDGSEDQSGKVFKAFRLVEAQARSNVSSREMQQDSPRPWCVTYPRRGLRFLLAWLVFLLLSGTASTHGGQQPER